MTTTESEPFKGDFIIIFLDNSFMQYFCGLFHLYVAVKLFHHSPEFDRNTEREEHRNMVALPKRT